MRRPTRRLFSAILFLLAAALPAAAQGIEAQFRQWLQNDLWPEARGRGISAETFNAAFSGVSVNLKLPDLVLPGQKPDAPRTQPSSARRATISPRTSSPASPAAGAAAPHG
jgi:membrane-bound lytic murein transglycosylase B